MVRCNMGQGSGRVVKFRKTTILLYNIFDRPIKKEINYFQIFGFDKHENQLERLISTSIEVKETSPPLVEIATKKLIIKEGDDFSIKCHVRSALPISVKWFKNNDELLADEFE